jgi:two-component system, OmpR family, sensor histidine kinase CiaH
MWASGSKKNNMSKMPADNRVQLRRATIVYWILLTYILAALIWWFVSLERQNREVTDLKYKNLSEHIGLSAEEKFDALNKIDSENKRNTAKYIGEGVAFLLLIVVGAIFIYRSVRRQFIMQQQQQNFMMAVTHELKTPISVARLNLETIQKYQLDPEKQKKLIRMTLDETARLNSLTNNILVSSQLEGGGYQSSMEELDLSDLLKDRMQDFRNRFPERNFTEEIAPDIELKGDALLLQMLINNLVENAIKYSPKETSIKAQLFMQDNDPHLIISDLGPGVPDSEKKKVFNKFYRVGNESTRKTQGTGLGLYLCQSIAGYHNADISVTDNKPSGSKFAVIFHT